MSGKRGKMGKYDPDDDNEDEGNRFLSTIPQYFEPSSSSSGSRQSRVTTAIKSEAGPSRSRSGLGLVDDHATIKSEAGESVFASHNASASGQIKAEAENENAIAKSGGSTILFGHTTLRQQDINTSTYEFRSHIAPDGSFTSVYGSLKYPPAQRRFRLVPDELVTNFNDIPHPPQDADWEIAFRTESVGRDWTRTLDGSQVNFYRVARVKEASLSLERFIKFGELKEEEEDDVKAALDPIIRFKIPQATLTFSSVIRDEIIHLIPSWMEIRFSLNDSHEVTLPGGQPVTTLAGKYSLIRPSQYDHVELQSPGPTAEHERIVAGVTTAWSVGTPKFGDMRREMSGNFESAATRLELFYDNPVKSEI